MTGERSARFALLADYDVWAPRWTGRVAWAERATRPDWFEIIERASPRERSVFGFPAPGDPYWDEQTLADTQTRYPRADLTPYRLQDRTAGPMQLRRRRGDTPSRCATSVKAASIASRRAGIIGLTVPRIVPRGLWRSPGND
jgi:hypothetical protein